MKILVACEESQTVGIMSSAWRKPDQIIQPWQFGDAFEKRTCLWLKGLPRLQPTNIVDIPPRKVFDSGKSMQAWYADAWTLPKEERAKIKKQNLSGHCRGYGRTMGVLA